jgi:hypothetical protein
MTLEELDGAYVLAYYSPDSAGGIVVRKHRIVLTPTEIEQVLRRARARRRSPPPGWLLQCSSVASDPVRLVRVTDADPVFRPTPAVAFEYTTPSLTARSAAAIVQSDNGRVSGIYRAHRVPGKAHLSAEERLLKPFDAAILIAVVYARCLDPIRFPGASHDKMGKGQVIGAFAHSLTTRKVLAAVKLVAQHMEDLRSLDIHQARLGTNTARWMQYLAIEVLSLNPSGLEYEQAGLFAVLSTIRESETIADRFAAIRQHSPGEQ